MIGAQNLLGIDFSGNEFKGNFPYEYFQEDTFQVLEYVSVNFNNGVEVPDICVRLPYCFKRTIMMGIDANQENFLEREIISLIESSIDTFEGPVVDL